jgi:hypothetical protein
MTGFGFASKKGRLAVQHVQVVALYNPDDGTIKHIHTVTTMQGAKPVAHDQVVSDARCYASRRHKNSDTLAVALSNDVEHARRPHRIDLNSKSFIPISASK